MTFRSLRVVVRFGSLLTAVVALSSPVGAQPAARAQQDRAAAADTVYVALEEMVRTALTNNLTLAAAAAEMRGVQTYSRVTRSRFDPSLNVGGNTDTREAGGQLVGRVPTGASYMLGSVAPSMLPGQALYDNAFMVSVSQPLLRGLGMQSMRPSIRAVDETVAASRARLERTRVEVAASVGVAYAVLVQRHRQEAIAERSVRRAEELRDAYTELRELGKITEVDLITAKLGVTSRRAALLEFRRDRQDAQDALIFSVYGARAAATLGGDDRVLIPRDTAVVLPELPSLDSAIALAIDRRTDLLAARHEASGARYRVQNARNSVLPSLDLTGAYIGARDNTRLGLATPTVEPRREEWTLGFVFTRPLRNMGATAERARFEAAQSQAEATVADAENAVRAEVRASFRSLALGREQVALASEASQLARAQYEGERERLSLGLTDIFRVLQYEEQVARVERAEADAWFALAASVVGYWLATGTTVGTERK